MNLDKLFHNVNVDNSDKVDINIYIGIDIENKNNNNENEKCTYNSSNNHKIILNNWTIDKWKIISFHRNKEDEYIKKRDREKKNKTKELDSFICIFIFSSFMSFLF